MQKTLCVSCKVKSMPTFVILAALVAFVVVAALLVHAGRGAPDPASTALRVFAQQTQGQYARQFAGFGRMVALEADGWLLTFKVSSGLAGPGESIASFRQLNAYSEYRQLRPFVLELTPKAVAGRSLTLAVDRPPVATLVIPEIADAYSIRTSDAALAAVLLRDPQVLAHLVAVCRPTSSLSIGPVHAGLLQRTVVDRGAVAFNEEEEPVTLERLLAIRDLLTTLLAGLARQQVAGALH